MTFRKNRTGRSLDSSRTAFRDVWSPYSLNGAVARSGDEWVVEAGLADDTRHIVDRLLADPRVALPMAVALDAGVILGAGAAIVEANEASGSGVYGCDPLAVLEVLRAATSGR